MLVTPSLRTGCANGELITNLQFLRELTQNSIESIQKTKEKRGEVIWDADWQQFNDTGRYKLCITDNGKGMTGEELVSYINALSSSGSEQSFTPENPKFLGRLRAPERIGWAVALRQRFIFLP